MRMVLLNFAETFSNGISIPFAYSGSWICVKEKGTFVTLHRPELLVRGPISTLFTYVDLLNAIMFRGNEGEQASVKSNRYRDLDIRILPE